MKNKTLLIFLAFICMSFGIVAGLLASQLHAHIDLTNFMAGSITFMGFTMVGLFYSTIDSKPERNNVISGLLLAAIIVGAILSLVFGIFADVFILMAGLLLLLAAIIYLLFVSFKEKATA